MLSLTTHPWWRRWFGSRSERSAAGFLKALGYRILARNFTCDLGVFRGEGFDTVKGGNKYRDPLQVLYWSRCPQRAIMQLMQDNR